MQNRFRRTKTAKGAEGQQSGKPRLNRHFQPLRGSLNMIIGERLCYIINHHEFYVTKADVIVGEDGVEVILERPGEAIPFDEAYE